MIRFGAAVPAVAAALALGCGPVRSVEPPALVDPPSISALELAGEFNIPPLTTFDALESARFGGVSGLATDPLTGDLLGISDDRSESRVFVFRLPAIAAGAPFRVALHAYFPLPVAADAPAGLDPEGIAMSGEDGRFFIASEGIQNRVPRVPPAVVEYARNHEFVRQLTVPSKFIPPSTGPITTGVRDNAAFESLTMTPDRQRLYTATESPLVQDGPAATATSGAIVRILEYQREGDTFAPAREFAYPIDAFGPTGFAPGFLVTGLVELLALGGTEFLALERGYATEAGQNARSVNRIRIFSTSIAGATDISARPSIAKDGGIVPARKTLLLDLADLEGLSPELASLDNFEGMALGPPLPDGSRTLLIVSDDNFNTRQRTSFLLFRIR